jgi:GT2 family glycosyltransferase
MISVIMATRNGSDTLARTLDAFANLENISENWKLVIVDNASTDATKDIIRAAASRLPIEYVAEPRPGKGFALNAGLERAEGDFVVLIDDDIIPEPNFLAAWRKAADSCPQFSVFGGAIIPDFETQPPSWLLDTDWMTGLYTATVPGRSAGEMRLGDVVDVYGPNMAIRSTVLQQGFRFDERLMTGPNAIIGDDSEFVIRLGEHGFRIGFWPEAAVRHLVNRSQITWRWMLRRFFRLGRFYYFLDTRRTPPDVPMWFKVPRFLIRRAFEKFLTIPLALFSFDARKVFDHMRSMMIDFGEIYQARVTWAHDRPTHRNGEARPRPA